MDKALIIVEGERVEPKLFTSLAQCFGMSVEIFVYATNIYDLFKRLKRDSDEQGGVRVLNIKDVLAERVKDEDGEKMSILAQDYAYTYLVYDCDIQHHEPNVPSDDVDCILNLNLPVLEQMLNYFTDETDETIGKLYVNYPMVESWRDANDFWDESYRDREVSLYNVKEYKKEVSARRLTGFGYDLTKPQFSQIILMMLAKLNCIIAQKWALPDYVTYRLVSDGVTVFNAERDMMIQRKVISVLNTSLFLVIDHFGKPMFETLIQGAET